MLILFISIIAFLINCIYFTNYGLMSTTYFYLICHYFIMRSKHISQVVHQLSSDSDFYEINRKNIMSLIREHNNVCQQLYKFNKFWQKYYISLLLTLMPLNLVLLVMILFSQLKFYMYIMYGCVAFNIWIFIFFISFCASLVSKTIYLSSNKLFWTQIHIKRNLRLKFKVLMFSEKCDKKRIVFGFSVGSQFVMTFPKLFFV